MRKYHYTYQMEIETPLDDRKYYIGLRSCDCLPVDDVTYTSSSTTVNGLISKGFPFKKTVLSVFDSRDDALKEEIRLHSLYNVADNMEYFNKANQTHRAFDQVSMWRNKTDEEKYLIGRKRSYAQLDTSLKLTFLDGSVVSGIQCWIYRDDRMYVLNGEQYHFSENDIKSYEYCPLETPKDVQVKEEPVKEPVKEVAPPLHECVEGSGRTRMMDLMWVCSCGEQRHADRSDLLDILDLIEEQSNEIARYHKTLDDLRKSKPQLYIEFIRLTRDKML